MGYIRLAWTGIIVVLVLIISLPFLLIDFLLGFINMKARDAFTLFVVRIFFKIILWSSGTRVHITGMENIPKDAPVLYVGNHRSIFDIVATYSLFPNMTAFVAKKEIAKVPVLSWWMRMLYNLFLDRQDVKQGLKTILQAVEYVKEGKSICIFPEGTRNKGDEVMMEFHAGSFKIAEKGGCSIIPMTMYNMSTIFEDHFPQIYSQDVYVDFGTPIDLSELSKEEKKHLADYTRDIMINRYQELEKQHEEFIAQKHR